MAAGSLMAVDFAVGIFLIEVVCATFFRLDHARRNWLA
jgi:hypothetical protein